jgi:hypothetical protein
MLRQRIFAICFATARLFSRQPTFASDRCWPGSIVVQVNFAISSLAATFCCRSRGKFYARLRLNVHGHFLFLLLPSHDNLFFFSLAAARQFHWGNVTFSRNNRDLNCLCANVFRPFFGVCSVLFFFNLIRSPCFPRNFSLTIFR